MKIAIARLRSGVRYTKPLEHILDSFYEMLKVFIREHPEHDYKFYNITFDASKPTRDVAAVKDSDVIIIPTEQEFHYHVPGYFHTLTVARSHEAADRLRPFIEGKRLILLRSDRADDEKLYREYTFRDLEFNCSIIDETDFPMGIHALKYWFIKAAAAEPVTGSLFDRVRDLDFTYWGTPKTKLAGGGSSGDSRARVLKEISKSKLSMFWIGRYDGIPRNLKVRPLFEILEYLNRTRATLCFNWLDSTATTSRYHEAMGTGIVPYVYQDYDSHNTLVKTDWQRVVSSDDFIDRVQSMNYEAAMDEVSASYKPLSVREYYELFEKKLAGLIS